MSEATLTDLLTGRIPPHSIEAERAVLGICLLDRDGLSQARELLLTSDFYLESHRRIFAALIGLFERNEPVDLLTVSEELRRLSVREEVGGPAALAGLMEEAGVLPNLPAYMKQVHEAAISRELIQQATNLIGRAYDQDRPVALVVEESCRTLTALAERAIGHVAPDLQRQGLDMSLLWPNGVRFVLTAIRDSREGLRGELTVTLGRRRLSWGSFSLSSTSARETLRRKLAAAAPKLPWGEYLEEAAFRLTQAAREGEPIVTLTGRVTSPTRELVPRLLYEGEPTLVYADGDTGKSLFALSLAVAVHSGVALPFGLRPARAVPAAYLDWETSRDTLEMRLALLAAGLGIDPPAIFYKRMTRPLVDEAGTLAAEFTRRGVGLVVIDSKMFAVAGGEGAAFHEPIVAFYNALRLFAPAASLVLSHVTNADARSGIPARPFGGAFAFNGPRLIWEARRDRDIDDATAIVFTCRKANNLARKPEPFGLRFQPGNGSITIYPFSLAEATPQATASVSLHTRLRVALAEGPRTVEELAERLDASHDVIRRTLNRGRPVFVALPNTKPQTWALGSPR